VVMVLAYLCMVEVAKRFFYKYAARFSPAPLRFGAAPPLV
jgi:hypothetical protein